MDLKWSKEEGSVAHPVLLIQPIFEKLTTTTNIKYSQMFVLLRIDMFPVSGFLLETVQNMLLAKPARKQQPQQLGKYWQEPILINMVKIYVKNHSCAFEEFLERDVCIILPAFAQIIPCSDDNTDPLKFHIKCSTCFGVTSCWSPSLRLAGFKTGFFLLQGCVLPRGHHTKSGCKPWHQCNIPPAQAATDVGPKKYEYSLCRAES